MFILKLYKPIIYIWLIYQPLITDAQITHPKIGDDRRPIDVQHKLFADKKKPHHQQIDFVMPSRSLAQSPLASSTKEGKKLSTDSYNEIKYREAGIRFIMLLYYDVRVAVEQ